jgi:hypothetical protein
MPTKKGKGSKTASKSKQPEGSKKRTMLSWMEEEDAAKKRAEADQLRKKAEELIAEADAKSGGGSAKKAKQGEGNATSESSAAKSTTPGDVDMPLVVDGPTFFGENLQEWNLAQAQSYDSSNAVVAWTRNHHNLAASGDAFKQMSQSRLKSGGNASTGGATSGGATSAKENDEEQQRREAAMTRYAAAKKGVNGEMTGQRCYRKQWEKEHPWLECRILEGEKLNPDTQQRETAKYQACFCKACEKCKYENPFTRGYVGGVNDGLKLDKIEDHATTSDHLKAVEAPTESENFKVTTERVLTTEVTALLHIICSLNWAFLQIFHYLACLFNCFSFCLHL